MTDILTIEPSRRDYHDQPGGWVELNRQTVLFNSLRAIRTQKPPLTTHRLDVKADENLRRYATPRQWEKIEALAEHGTHRKAAIALGINKASIGNALRSVQQKAAAHGYHPESGMINHTPPGFSVDRMTTLRDQDGETRLQWQRINRDAQQAQLAREAALQAMLEEIPPAPLVVPLLPQSVEAEGRLNLYILTDYHIGMLSWGEETGENWNTVIAEDLLIKWFRAAIQAAPPAEVGLFCQLGDFLHIDGLVPVTPIGQNVLDADTRFQDIVRVAVRVTKQIIAMLQQKYPHVHVIMADANHDPASGVWLREMLASQHEADPNITVDSSPDTYYCYPWGDTSLFFHHGHKRKPENVETVFAAKFRDIWGSTKHSYAHLGHMHHLKALENNLMIVEQHRTLAARDAYASRGGWIQGRSASVITYRKQYGEVCRSTFTPEMVT